TAMRAVVCRTAGRVAAADWGNKQVAFNEHGGAAVQVKKPERPDVLARAGVQRLTPLGANQEYRGRPAVGDHEWIHRAVYVAVEILWSGRVRRALFRGLRVVE